MEWCLGVRRHVQLSKIKQWDETEHPRYNVREADVLMEAEGSDPTRLRYSKMFWEAVPDGKDPVVPFLLEKARADGIRHVREEEESMNRARFVRLEPDAESTDKMKMIAPARRPMIKFIDVGAKFIDQHESLKRTQKVERRRALKARRREKVSSGLQRRKQEQSRVRAEARKAAKDISAAEKVEKAKPPKWQPGTGRSLVLE